MKKCVVLLLSIIFVLSFIMTGCGSQGAQSDTSTTVKAAETVTSQATTQEAPKEKIKVVVWSQNRHDKDIMDAKIADFNNTNKEISVDYVVQADNYGDLIKTASMAGNAPDIFCNPGGGIENLKNLSAPLGQLVGEGWLNTALPNDKCKLKNINTDADGNVYYIINSGFTARLLINTDLFKKAGLSEDGPKSVQDMREAAKKITEVGKKDGIYGIGWSPKDGTTRNFVWYIDMASGISGIVGYDYRAVQYNLALEKPALLALRDMYKDGSVIPNIGVVTYDEFRKMFADGKIGMIPGMSYDVGVLNDQFPATCNWKAVPMPTFDGTYDKGRVGVSPGGMDFCISKTSKVQQQAVEVFKYLYSDTVLDELAKQAKYQFFYEKYKNIQCDKKGFTDFVYDPKIDNLNLMFERAATADYKGPDYGDTDKVVFGNLSDKEIDKTLKALTDAWEAARESANNQGLNNDFKADPNFDFSK